MTKAHWCCGQVLVIWIWAFLALVRADQPVRTIYDPETDQHYPVSEVALREDPQFVLPDPDPKEFPPEFLAELLTHCDDPVPGAWEFMRNTWTAFREFAFNWSRYPVSHKVLLRILMAVRPSQLLHAFVIAIALSVVRYMLQYFLLESTKQRLGITTRNAQRLFESSWKAFWYLILWFCTFYAVILSGRTDFQYPLRIFRDLKMQVGYFDVPPPSDYYLVYTLQLGFYLHSLWSVICIDAWRKDSAVLIVHHVMTLLLLEFSLVLRLHRIGALVVLLHDLNDVFLESAKVNVYLRVRHGRNCPIANALSNVFFVLFSTSWIVMRLYWFPLKVLYATSWGLYITQVGRECRSFLFFNTMLWSLFLMHIYWFRFIFIMAVRLVLTPQCGDIREEEQDDEATPSTATSKNKNSTLTVKNNSNGVKKAGPLSNGTETVCSGAAVLANGIKKNLSVVTNQDCPVPVANGDVNKLRRR